MTVGEVLRLIFGGIFILFIPGLAWSYVFFLRKKIDWIERLGLSFGLSIALVPLAVFWLHWLFDMKIDLTSTSLTVVGLMVIAAAIIIIRQRGWGSAAIEKLKTSLVRNRKSPD